MTRLFVNELTVIDFAYLDHQRGIVGDSWMVDIELIGDLNEQGMVFDFGLVKKQIKQYIDDEIDHRLLIPIALDCCIETEEKYLTVKFGLHTGAYISHRSPRQAVLLLDTSDIHKAVICQYLEANIQSIMPKKCA